MTVLAGNGAIAQPHESTCHSELNRAIAFTRRARRTALSLDAVTLARVRLQAEAEAPVTADSMAPHG